MVSLFKNTQPQLFEDEPVPTIQRTLIHTNNYNEQQIELLNKLQEIRSRPIQTRINDLFIDIYGTRSIHMATNYRLHLEFDCYNSHDTN